jgi:hypothetical protein
MGQALFLQSLCVSCNRDKRRCREDIALNMALSSAFVPGSVLHSARRLSSAKIADFNRGSTLIGSGSFSTELYVFCQRYFCLRSTYCV